MAYKGKVNINTQPLFTIFNVHSSITNNLIYSINCSISQVFVLCCLLLIHLIFHYVIIDSLFLLNGLTPIAVELISNSTRAQELNLVSCWISSTTRCSQRSALTVIYILARIVGATTRIKHSPGASHWSWRSSVSLRKKGVTLNGIYF